MKEEKNSINVNVNKVLLSNIDRIFRIKLSDKTSWGKNEVYAMYREAVNEALIQTLLN